MPMNASADKVWGAGSRNWRIWFAATVVIFTCACRPETQPEQTATQGESAIVAGPSEKSFSERYDPTLKLPMAESRFIQLVGRLGLQYRLERERSAGAVIPTPRWTPSMDTSQIAKVYVVEGTYDAAAQTAERYRAYVSRNGEVVYIENTFAYPPIG